MKERPILFSAPMVRAILAGAKTQTRRVVKPQPTHFIGGPGITDAAGDPWPREPAIDEQSCSLVIRCPYGKVGDRLWVREAFRFCAEADATPPRDTDPAYRVWYEADKPHQPGAGKLRPGMFMPRWASRITLEVTGVRVERLQDISAKDAIAEGIPRGGPENPDGIEQREYRALWESINGPSSWAANPWVWVIEFRRLTGTQS